MELIIHWIHTLTYSFIFTQCGKSVNCDGGGSSIALILRSGYSARRLSNANLAPARTFSA